MDSMKKNMGLRGEVFGRIFHCNKLLLICVMVLSLCIAFASCTAPASEGNVADEAQAVAAAGQDAVEQDSVTSDSVTSEPAVSTAPTAPAVTTDGAATTTPAVKESSTTDAGVKSDKDKAKKKSDKPKDKTPAPAADKDKKSDKDADKKKNENKDTKKDKNDKDKNTAKPKPKDDKIKVKVSVDCKTLYATDPDLASKFGTGGVILSGKTVTLAKDASAYDALKASGLKISGKNYISSIAGLSEMDAGPESGWVFNVNGKYSGVGVTQFTLKDGDHMQFRYTLNGGSDVGANV